MSVEAPQSGGEAPRDPVQEARVALNRELVGRDYTKGVLVSRTLRLHNVLLQHADKRPDLSPDRVYHESLVVAEQGIQRAEVFEDADTASDLRELSASWRAAYNIFKPAASTEGGQPAQPAEPTRTEELPAMTGAKGDIQTQPRRSPTARKQPTTTPVPGAEGEGTEETQEENFSTFIRGKRSEAGLSQVRLGEAVGKKNIFISLLERGKGSIDASEVPNLAKALGLSEEDTQKLVDLHTQQFGEKK